MDKFIENIFYSELRKQCDFFLLALDDLENALTELKDEPNNMTRIWYSIQSMLISSGNISKILWPGEGSRDRGEILRKNLGVDDSSPLRSRKIRNHFEHFDERLEAWADLPGRKIFVDTCIFSSVKTISSDPNSILRNFEITRFILFFRGEEYPLRPVIKEVRELKEKLESVIR